MTPRDSVSAKEIVGARYQYEKNSIKWFEFSLLDFESNKIENFEFGVKGDFSYQGSFKITKGDHI